MLVLGLDRRGSALFGLLVEETHLVHGASKSFERCKVPHFIG
jgi:hypothetical protein